MSSKPQSSCFLCKADPAAVLQSQDDSVFLMSYTSGMGSIHQRQWPCPQFIVIGDTLQRGREDMSDAEF